MVIRSTYIVNRARSDAEHLNGPGYPSGCRFVMHPHYLFNSRKAQNLMSKPLLLWRQFIMPQQKLGVSKIVSVFAVYYPSIKVIKIFDRKQKADLTIDCGGAILSSGFIDIQINGGFGVDFSSQEDVDTAINTVGSGLLEFGVTSYCPTIVSSQPAVYRQVLETFTQRHGQSRSNCTVAQPIGLHLEGPFMSSEKRGAHKLQNVISVPSSLDAALHVYHCGNPSLFDNVAIVTLAPEVPFAVELTKYFHSRNIKVSMGHSQASLAEAEKVFQAGASGLTHLFNAMGPFHHKDPGLVGMLTSKYVTPETMVYFGVIADGIHTEDAALRIAQKTLPDGLILTSDANAGLGLGDGVHLLGDSEVEIRGKHAVIKGTDVLAGSVCPMSECVKHLIKASRCTVVEALEAASLHPAQFLSEAPRKGTLDFGADADFVLLDQHSLDVLATFIGGKMVWRRKDVKRSEH